jgi:hypothetical protein
LLFWYYVSAFCSVYGKSSTSWLSGGFISQIIGLCVVQVSIPMANTIIRTWAKHYPKNGCAKFFYTIMFKFF